MTADELPQDRQLAPDGGAKDNQTVRADGSRLGRWIAGVQFRPAPTQTDERGEVVEICNPLWGDAGEEPKGGLGLPLVYCYQAMVRPGWVKGWVYHERQFDRLFCATGHLRIVLHDLRADSPTAGLTQEVFAGERCRGLLMIPPLVAHAVQNIGSTDAVFINLPSRPYDHADPDKYRIPLDGGRIPFRFEHARGW